MWIYILDADDVDLSYHGSGDARKSLHVADVSKGIQSLASGPSVEEDVYIQLWWYHYYDKGQYAANLCDL